jgi:hypothetical protein
MVEIWGVSLPGGLVLAIQKVPGQLLMFSIALVEFHEPQRTSIS